MVVPYYRTQVDDGTILRASGVGDVGLDLKWRFHGSGIWSAALKPGLVLPTGDETRGLGAGRLRYSVFMVVSADLARWEVHLYLGRLQNRNTLGEREEIDHISFAATRDIGRVRLVADIGKNTAADPSLTRDPAFATAGVTVALVNNFDIDMGYKKAIASSEVDRSGSPA